MAHTEEALSAIVQQIERDPDQWSVCTEQGVAYIFVDGVVVKKTRQLHQANFILRNSVSAFLHQVLRQLSTMPFVLLHLGHSCHVNLIYCHRRIVHLDQCTNRVLLLGSACLVKGSYRNYLAEALPPLASGSVIRLDEHSFQVRVRAYEHWIHVRPEDLENGNVEVFATVDQVTPTKCSLKCLNFLSGIEKNQTETISEDTSSDSE